MYIGYFSQLKWVFAPIFPDLFIDYFEKGNK
jgi:hypothetical protein